MKYDTTRDKQVEDEFIEYFQPKDDLIEDYNDKDRVANIYPVFIPEASVNSEPSEILTNLPNPQPELHPQPPSLFLPKLGEEYPVFSSKLPDQPPVFQPEYLEHSPVFYYSHDDHGVSNQELGDGDAITHSLNSISDNELQNDSGSLDILSIMDLYDDGIAELTGCSSLPCLTQPDHACCSPHTAKKRQADKLLWNAHQDVLDHEEDEDSPGHDRVTATVTRTVKSVTW